MDGPLINNLFLVRNSPRVRLDTKKIAVALCPIRHETLLLVSFGFSSIAMKNGSRKTTRGTTFIYVRVKVSYV